MKDRIYISHGAGRAAGGEVTWFVVEPAPVGMERTVEHLLRSGRRVYVLKAKRGPFLKPLRRIRKLVSL